GLLFAGTGEGLYYSLDDGAHWTHLSEGLPPSPVTWTVVQKRFHDLVVSTWGRGLYVLDDISALEQMARHPSDAPVRLFAPRATWRLTRDPHVLIDFSLKTAPKNEVSLEVLDAQGTVVRTIHKKARNGMNRIDWDMQYEDLEPIVLRTIPPQDPTIWHEERFKGKSFRPVTHWGMPAIMGGALALPGHYQLRLTAGGTKETAPLDILRDPHSETGLAGMKATFGLQSRIAGDVARTAGMVNLAEQMRAQLQAMESAKTKDAALAGAARGLDDKIQSVEYELFSRDLAPSDDK
ncbi:MAG: hypothetical protein ACREHV_13445, partial [Rhizomicrobium sp.]